MHCRTISILALIPVILADTPVTAQSVGVHPGGGVSVRAPFVRVDVDPWGGTSVRAPFTNVFTPGRRPPLVRQLGRAGAGVDLAQMNYRQLRGVLRDAAYQLERQLEQVQSGRAWIRSLQPGTLRDLLAEDTDSSLDQATSDRLRQVLEAYQETAANGHAIASLPEFRTVHAALLQLLQPPAERKLLQLSASATDLENSLTQFTTGAGWQNYLRLPGEVLSTPEGSLSDSTALDELEKTLARYDAVAQEVEYRQITRLESFQATHANLREYLRLFKSSTSDEPLPVEELPHPQRIN